MEKEILDMVDRIEEGETPELERLPKGLRVIYAENGGDPKRIINFLEKINRESSILFSLSERRNNIASTLKEMKPKKTINKREQKTINSMEKELRLIKERGDKIFGWLMSYMLLKYK